MSSNTKISGQHTPWCFGDTSAQNKKLLRAPLTVVNADISYNRTSTCWKWEC